MSSPVAAALEVVVDEEMILETAPDSVVDSAYGGFAAFRAQAYQLLSATMVEDGVPHPAETYFASVLRAQPLRVPGWLEALYAEYAERNAILAAGLVRCVGRCGLAVVGDWGVAIMRAALRHGDVRIRDAAVVAIDGWGDPALLILLDPQREPIARLARYMHAIRHEDAAGIPYYPSSETMECAPEHAESMRERRVPARSSGVSVQTAHPMWERVRPYVTAYVTAMVAVAAGVVVLLVDA
ncbi:hypothetical protein HYV74_04135 [Candidatus Uhrbacteria bacterium]|nr:hypothetical protein [Candidatus Uhrbacteria bacterium]